MHLTRRAVLKGVLAGAAGMAGGAAAYGIGYERHHLGVTEAALPVRGLPAALSGVRIALLTDIHHSELVGAEDVTAAVDLALSLKPDLIVLGGDYVSFADRKFVEPVAEGEQSTVFSATPVAAPSSVAPLPNAGANAPVAAITPPIPTSSRPSWFWWVVVLVLGVPAAIGALLWLRGVAARRRAR